MIYYTGTLNNLPIKICERDYKILLERFDLANAEIKGGLVVIEKRCLCLLYGGCNTCPYYKCGNYTGELIANKVWPRFLLVQWFKSDNRKARYAIRKFHKELENLKRIEE